MTNPADEAVGTMDGQPRHEADREGAEPPAQIPPPDAHGDHHGHQALVPVAASHGAKPKPRLLAGDDTGVLEHMRMLQGVINRLAGNSASAKTWCIAVVSGLLALAGSAHVPVLAVVAFIAVAVFGLTDAMYLAQERLYRDLFNAKARLIRDEGFSADHLYDFNSGEITIFQVGSAIESWSIYPIYLVLLAVCLLVAVALSVTGPIPH